MSWMPAFENLEKVVPTRLRDVVTVCGATNQDSMTVGSPITGSQGQPVDTGALRGSYVLERIDDFRALTSTHLDYAQDIEDGVGPGGPLTLRSAVGEFHCREKTINAWPRTVSDAVRKVVPR